MCHPSNGNNKEYGWLEDKIKFGKGSISTQCGYMCTLQHPDKSNKDEFQY
jgi:hypothetical protein